MKYEKADIARLSKAAGFNLSEQDQDEVRFRLNALAEALAQLDDDELQKVDPLPLMTGDEVQQNG